jgi:hypothetical protein
LAAGCDNKTYRNDCKRQQAKVVKKLEDQCARSPLLVINAAKGGDMTAARIIVERLCPPRRDRHIAFELPPISNAQHLPQAALGLLRAVVSGEVTPEEAGRPSSRLNSDHSACLNSPGRVNVSASS